MSIGLDIAAGIAGLITLSDVVITRTYKTIKACKSASKESRDLLKHIQALLGVLKGVDSLANEAASGTLESCIPADEVINCQTTLEALRDRLTIADPSEARILTRAKRKRTLLWPITADETKDILEDLDRYMTIFDASLSVDTLTAVLITTKQTRSIVSIVESTAQDIVAMRKSIDFATSVVLQQERRTVLSFFHALDAADQHATHIKCRQHDTRPGRRSESVFDSWLEGTLPTLWITGQAGVGKTALASAFIDAVRQRTRARHGLAYYYCRGRQSVQSILACLAGQLAWENQQCFELLYRLFNEGLGQRLPSVGEMHQLLQRCMKHFSSTRIIVDGVADCEDPDALDKILVSLSQDRTTSILALSRPAPNEFSCEGEHFTPYTIKDLSLIHISEPTRPY